MKKKSAQHKTIKARRKYDEAFKQQALQMLRLGQLLPMVAQALGVGEALLYKRQQAQRPAAMD